MKIWVDAQLSPSIARWIATEFNIECTAVRDLDLRNAEDRTIFFAARKDGAVVLTKDQDFVLLLEQYGPPPHVLWLTCGNTSNGAVKELLLATLSNAVDLVLAGDAIVELS